MSDSLIRRLGGLPIAEPDRARTEYITTRCRARLARHGLVPRAPALGERIVPVWQTAIAVLGFLYLTQVIRFALGLYSLW